MTYLAALVILLPAEAETPPRPTVEVYAVEYHENGDYGSRVLWQADQDGRTGEWFLRFRDRDWWLDDSFPEWDGTHLVIYDGDARQWIRAEQVWWTVGDFDPTDISQGRAK